MGLQQGHQAVEIRRRHLVVVAQAGMRCVHQLAEGGGVDRLDGLQHRRIFGQHVPDTPAQGVGQGVDRAGVGGVGGVVDIAPARNTEQARRFFAFAAARVVAAGSEGSGNTRVEHQQGTVARQLDPSALQASGVQPKGMTGVGQMRWASKPVPCARQ